MQADNWRQSDLKYVVCGSMQNRELLRRLGKYYTGPPHFATVITPLNVPFEGTKVPAEKALNREFYFKQIKDARKVIVCNKNHIGIGTSFEIGYALGLDKCIELTNIPEAQPEDQIELVALIHDNKAWVTKEDYVLLLCNGSITGGLLG